MHWRYTELCLVLFIHFCFWSPDVIQTSCFASSQGSVAIAGAVVRWLKDNMGIVKSSSEIGTLTVAAHGLLLFL